MGVNFWFEHVIDAYLAACAEGRDWRPAVIAAQTNTDNIAPRRVLTQKALRSKGIGYSRQHLRKLIRWGRFPRPFQLPADP